MAALGSAAAALTAAIMAVGMGVVMVMQMLMGMRVGMVMGMAVAMGVAVGMAVVGVLMSMFMAMVMAVNAGVIVIMMIHGNFLLGIFSLLYCRAGAMSKHLFVQNNPREGLRQQTFWSIMGQNAKKKVFAMCHSHDHDHDHDHAYLHQHGIPHTHGHVHENQKAVINRLARAIGHLEKVKRMVEDGQDCSDVLVQLAAVRSALDNTGKVILQDHLRHCMVDAVAAGDENAIDDLCQAIDKFMK